MSSRNWVIGSARRSAITSKRISSILSRTRISRAYGELPASSRRNQGISVKGESHRSIMSGISRRSSLCESSEYSPKTTLMMDANEIASISSWSFSR